MPEKQLVLASKSALNPEKRGRNSLVDLLVRARYDKVLNGLNRQDEFEQGDFIFRGVKDASSMAVVLETYKNQSLPIFMGSDILAEADYLARSRGVKSRIRKLLSLGIGECRLCVMAPEEDPIKKSADITGREMFTKYPEILKAMLAELGIQGVEVRAASGADTRINETRGGDARVGALDVVGSGETARVNRLQIVGSDVIDQNLLGLRYFDLGSVTTDMYLTNRRYLNDPSSWSRDAIQRLGIALEAAESANEHSSIQWNAPQSIIDRFLDMGMRGPSIQKIHSTGGEQWYALKIFVPVGETDKTMRELLHRGARDLGVSESPFMLGRSAEEMEILDNLPFLTQVVDTPLEPTPEHVHVASAMVKNRDEIAERDRERPVESNTVEWLQKGSDACASKYGAELQELSTAIGTDDTENLATEASQCLYWYMVMLQSNKISLDEVVERLVAGGTDGDLAEKIAWYLAQNNHVRRLGSDVEIEPEPKIARHAVTDRFPELSSAIREKQDAKMTPVVAAERALRDLFALIKAAEVDLPAMAEKI